MRRAQPAGWVYRTSTALIFPPEGARAVHRAKLLQKAPYDTTLSSAIAVAAAIVAPRVGSLQSGHHGRAFLKEIN